LPSSEPGYNTEKGHAEQMEAAQRAMLANARRLRQVSNASAELPVRTRQQQRFGIPGLFRRTLQFGAVLFPFSLGLAGTAPRTKYLIRSEMMVGVAGLAPARTRKRQAVH
jgi:hypothetical protein